LVQRKSSTRKKKGETKTKGTMNLQNTVARILNNCHFDKVDLEIDIDVDNDNKIELSIDVGAIYNKTLFVFQCKDVKSISHIKAELSSTKSYFKKVLSKNFDLKKSKKKIITTDDLKKIKEIKCCYAFTEQLTNEDTKKEIINSKFNFWNHMTVKYYNRISAILQQLTRNEILKEFGYQFVKKKTTEEIAVEIKQEGNTMYMLGMHPGLLLKIAYVYRRTGVKPDAYQRLINKDRLDNISRFFKESKNLLLPNPVIIVFDKDVRNKVRYYKGKKILKFSTALCSAWIIDGQHRIFGFRDHPKYGKLDEDEEKEEDFKIPVVAFKELKELEQNKTFVNINYYQKKIDAVLFNDLSTIIQDLKQEITWPSLLIAELNKRGVWKDRIKISELDEKKPISISGFAKTKLQTVLLGFKKIKKQPVYQGILYRIAQFDVNKSFTNDENQKAFKKHVTILNRFFKAIRDNVYQENEKEDWWINSTDYSLTRFTAVNALLLVLNALLEKDPRLSMDLDKWMSVINEIDFSPDGMLEFGRPGYPAMPHLANAIIKKINDKYNAGLQLVKTAKKE